MTYKLMRASAADPLDAKGERRMFENGKVAEFKNLSQEFGDLIRFLTKQLLNRRIRITKPRSSSHNLFWIGSVSQKLDEHGLRFQIGPRRPGYRAESRNGTREFFVF